ncbi:PTS sugar transporter subunit IIA [Lactiplantibacillus pentosus]|uniref:PTS sugar transporter subunit IIA n=1 Tax=Lactiplantibacillus pentosus TaxID=1589 RepID=UPI001C1F13A1|nr:PTS mannose transporter subunit IIB [Lactiplantibacillus pentosus]MBU7510963.1 PTS mannose transporter subunit IIB [Lactiplantibacillus pentosus]MBU7523913.1 PTS mannose transporter subunit IIB [Lactiplantibacillus pentosus]
MVDILLISHGPFCEGLLASLQMIAGPQSHISAISLKEGQAPETYREEIETKIKSINNKCLVFCDIKGGTPYNSAGSLKSKYDFNLITGMNLPMLISVVTTRFEDTTVEALTNTAMASESRGIELIDLSANGGHKHAKLSLNKD